MLLLTVSLFMAYAVRGMLLSGVTLGQKDEYDCLLVDLKNRSQMDKEFPGGPPYFTDIMEMDGKPWTADARKDAFQSKGYKGEGFWITTYGRLFSDKRVDDNNVIRARLANRVQRIKDIPEFHEIKADRVISCPAHKVVHHFKDIDARIREFGFHLVNRFNEPVDILFPYGMGCGEHGPHKWTDSERQIELNRQYRQKKIIEKLWGSEQWSRIVHKTYPVRETHPMRQYICQWRDSVNRAAERKGKPAPIKSMKFVAGFEEQAVGIIRPEDICHFPEGQQAYIRAVQRKVKAKVKAKKEGKPLDEAQLKKDEERLKEFVELEQELRLAGEGTEKLRKQFPDIMKLM